MEHNENIEIKNFCKFLLRKCTPTSQYNDKLLKYWMDQQNEELINDDLFSFFTYALGSFMIANGFINQEIRTKCFSPTKLQNFMSVLNFDFQNFKNLLKLTEHNFNISLKKGRSYSV